MDAPYTESEVESLIVNDQLSREHALAESIWRTADRAVAQALTIKTGNLSYIIREGFVTGRVPKV
jgi:hypothetical protein